MESRLHDAATNLELCRRVRDTPGDVIYGTGAPLAMAVTWWMSGTYPRTYVIVDQTALCG